MSGFSSQWLALREPADHASINHQVRSALVRHCAGAPSIEVVDLGSGTGSNFRSLAPDLSRPQSWTLVDIDASLLDVAADRCADVAKRCSHPTGLQFRVADLSDQSLDDMFGAAGLITASALFDLVSAPAIERIADAAVSAGAVFYTTLTYDGVAAWLPEHRLNQPMRQAFNRHQMTDKGFGPAAGPDATRLISTAFERRGYAVMVGASPWILDRSQAELRDQTNLGWAAAVKETGQVSESDIESWLHAQEAAPDNVSIIGHTDLLALPPTGSAH